MAFPLVNPSRYSDLLKTLECRLPKSAMSHNILKLVMNNCYSPSISTKVYAFDNKIQEIDVGQEAFIVFELTRQIPGDYAIIVSPPKDVTPEMKMEFESLVDWRKSIGFCATEVPFSLYVAELCRKHGRLTEVDRCDMMTMSVEKGKSIKLPSRDDLLNIEVITLSPSDADLVAKRWKFSNPNSKRMLEERIKYAGSAGVKLEGKLVSWVVIFEIGSINALYTEDDFRGKGYAALTMAKVCQIAAKKGLVPNVQIEIRNDPSKKLMTKVGFENSHLIEWVSFRPK